MAQRNNSKMCSKVSDSSHKTVFSHCTRPGNCSQYHSDQSSVLQGNMSASLLNNLNKVTQRMAAPVKNQLYQIDASFSPFTDNTAASIQLSLNNYSFTPGNALVTRSRSKPRVNAPSLTPSRRSSTPTPVPARVDLEEMSAIDASGTRCGSAMEWSVDASAADHQWQRPDGPFSSTMMYPSRSTPIHMRQRSSVLCDTQDLPTGLTVCKLEFEEDSVLSVDDNNTVVEDTVNSVHRNHLKRLISDNVVAMFNFQDSDDSMDTHVDSLHTPSSSSSSLASNENHDQYPPAGPARQQCSHATKSRTSDRRPACLGKERSPRVAKRNKRVDDSNSADVTSPCNGVKRNARLDKEQSVLGQNDTDSAYSSVYSNGTLPRKSSSKNFNEVTHTVSKSSWRNSNGAVVTASSSSSSCTKWNDTVNSDSASFMEKPLCQRGVAWNHLEKSRKRSILGKLKKIGRHLHGKGAGLPSCTEQMETLAVL